MFPVVLYFFLFLPVLIILGIIRYSKELSELLADVYSFSQLSSSELFELFTILKSSLFQFFRFKKTESATVATATSKTLMEEEPYAAVVKGRYIPYTCSKCFAWNPTNKEKRVLLTPCAGCMMLHYCSAKCQEADWSDHETECKLFRSFKTSHSCYFPAGTTRLVCRVILKLKAQPEWKAFNGRTFDCLMDHTESERKDESYMEVVRDSYEELKALMGSEAPDFETYFLVSSKIGINCFSINDGSQLNHSRGTGIYIGVSELNHSCRSDVFAVCQGSKLLLRTTNTDLSYSNQLTISYMGASFLKDTESRREYLRKNYFFTCMCEECLDIETDKKRTSGRPECCPEGWFSLTDLRCSICDKDVDQTLGVLAKEANKKLDETMEKPSNPINFSSVDWIELYQEYKKVLSDENAFLLGFALKISELTSNLRIAIQFNDVALPLVRNGPADYFRASALCFRYYLLNQYNKSFEDTRDALEEALETIRNVFGPDHELTREFMKKQHEYKMFARLVNI